MPAVNAEHSRALACLPARPSRSLDAEGAGQAPAGQTAAALRKEKRKRPKLTLDMLKVGWPARLGLGKESESKSKKAGDRHMLSSTSAVQLIAARSPICAPALMPCCCDHPAPSACLMAWVAPGPKSPVPRPLSPLASCPQGPKGLPDVYMNFPDAFRRQVQRHLPH